MKVTGLSGEATDSWMDRSYPLIRAHLDALLLTDEFSPLVTSIQLNCGMVWSWLHLELIDRPSVAGSSHPHLSNLGTHISEATQEIVTMFQRRETGGDYWTADTIRCRILEAMRASMST